MTAHVDPVVLESSRGVERARLLDHAASCAACRRAIALHEPALLFALLARAPIPERVLDQVASGTARRLGEHPESIGERIGWSSWARPAAAAAVAAAALLTWVAASLPAGAPRPVLAAAPPRAGVEVAPGSGVSQVVDFTVGDTQVVMVYNPELEL